MTDASVEKASLRLTTLTTRTGDDGSSGLADGSRHLKSHPRFEALGAVDELNSMLGVLHSVLPTHLDGVYAQWVLDIQHDLFDLGSELALPGYEKLNEHAVACLEAWTEHFQSFLSPLKEFILPGGHQSAATAHMARTLCRRAERAVIALHQHEVQRMVLRQYLNRLSDPLFAFARFLNQQSLQSDQMWQPQREGMHYPPSFISHVTS